MSEDRVVMGEYWPEEPCSKGDRVAGLMRDYYDEARAALNPDRTGGKR